MPLLTARLNTGRFLLLTAFILLTGCKSPPPEEMVLIPAGEFTMGSNEVDREAKALQYGSKKPWYANERPERKVYLPEYYIDRTEVTNKKYKDFLDAAKRTAPPDWANGAYPGSPDNPVVSVTWADASAYCEWKDKRLPTEQEWEKAARGTDGRRFPWGDDFDIKKVNTLGEYQGVTPVGVFPEGKSPYGVLDMSGNAQEWTADWYKPYPGSDYNDKDYGEKFRVIRGGGWGGMGHYTLQVYVRSAFRSTAPPEGRFNDVGFRCVWPK